MSKKRSTRRGRTKEDTKNTSLTAAPAEDTTSPDEDDSEVVGKLGDEPVTKKREREIVDDVKHKHTSVTLTSPKTGETRTYSHATHGTNWKVLADAWKKSQGI